MIRNSTVIEESKNGDWTKEYQKTFACRLCNSSWSFWKSAKKHIKKHDALKLKHADVFNKYCLVELSKIDSKPNITDSMHQVVYSKEKIIGPYNSDFCISYKYTGIQSQQNSNSISESETTHANSFNSDESSDSEMKNQKVGRRRRRRICSMSSNETVVLENKSNGKPQENNCISIEDTDSDDEKKKTEKTKVNNKKSKNVKAKMIAVTKLINTTHNKYIKKQEQPDKPSVQQLTRKITSIGRQIINRRGFNTTRLMKYMEHLNLNIIWLPRSPQNVTSNSNYFKIIPRWKYPDEKKGNQFEGYNKRYESPPFKPSKPEVTIIQNTITAQESSAVVATGKEISSQSVEPNLRFSGANCSTSVSTSVITGLTVTPAFNTGIISGVNVKPTYNASVMSGSNITPPAVSDSVTNRPDLAQALRNAAPYADTRKVLNKYPVANPRQLPKKYISYDKTDEAKSTVSRHALEVNAAEPSKVTSSDCENSMQMPIITSTTSLFVREPQQIETSNSENPNVKAPRIKVKSVTELMSKETLSRMKESAAPVPQNQLMPQNGVAFKDFGGHQIQNTNLNTTVPTVSDVRSVNPSGNEYITLDSVELPNTRTNSPFKYFRMLLQFHNLNLLDSDITLTAEFKTLIKFKVLYNQEKTDVPVILCLSLFCSGKDFCLKIKDRNDDNINMIKISANWQWEVLKIYRGDVVTKVLHNAEKISQEIYTNTNRFLCLLKSINYIKK